MKKYKLYWTLLTINAGLPLDKLVVFMLSILYYFQNSKSFRAKALVVFCILFMLAFTSFIVNADRNILIFYPFLFFFLAVLAGNAEANVKLTRFFACKHILGNILGNISIDWYPYDWKSFFNRERYAFFICSCWF